MGAIIFAKFELPLELEPELLLELLELPLEELELPELREELEPPPLKGLLTGAFVHFVPVAVDCPTYPRLSIKESLGEELTLLLLLVLLFELTMFAVIFLPSGLLESTNLPVIGSTILSV